jgi:predicted ATPase
VITQIQILGFKRFQDRSFSLAPLTVLAGLNGSGKTSLIHAMLLACEASVGGSAKTVRLNGPFGVELGAAGQVRNWESSGAVEFRIESDSEKLLVFSLGVPSDDSLYLDVKKKPSKLPFAFSGKPRSFCYLSAERLGPRNVLGASPRPNDALEVGVRGENSAHIMAALGNKLMTESNRLHPLRKEDAPALLKYELELWIGEIAKPVEIDAEQYPGSTITALKFRSPGGELVSPTNMGFGVSFALPVILAGLIAPKESLFIVENPEAHLHPAGQSRIGTFLAWLAGRGVQVLLETHSDHVLNGVRRAIGEYKYLDHQSANVHFFEDASDRKEAVHQLAFTPIGGISHWPKGFFDQFQIDASSLGKIRRMS